MNYDLLHVSSLVMRKKKKGVKKIQKIKLIIAKNAKETNTTLIMVHVNF